MPVSNQDFIQLRGIRQNNLKNFDLDLPLGKLIVVTGLSGAGKSSLVFETLHAEGQRRYVETFSSYTRQFLEMLDRPEVDSIENIRPSIAIQQSNTVKTSRSTIGTMTELCDFFKVWFCNEAQLFDPETGELVEDDNPETIWLKTLKALKGDKRLICFSIEKPEKISWKEIQSSLISQGFSRAVYADEVIRIQNLDTESLKTKSINVVVDRVEILAKAKSRFIDAATTALHFGQGQLQLFLADAPKIGTAVTFSEGLHAPSSDRHFKHATPALFSFNSPIGACPKCRGFGRVVEIDYRLVIPDINLSIEAGAIKPFQGQIYSESLRDLVRTSKKRKIRTNIPWKDLSEAERTYILEGDPDYGDKENSWPKLWYGVKRFFNWLESNTYKMHVRVFLSKFRSYTPCSSCDGTRLVPDALNWKWQGYTLPELYLLPIGDLFALLEKNAKQTGNHQVDIALDAIKTRLSYLSQVGLEYLTLDRSSRTLSGGEVQRVNLTACLGTSLVDTLFILDEPSIGLHSRDIDRLIGILRRLTDLGNTVIVVEHDEAIMRAADHIIELGPEPGSNGGQLTFNGNYSSILKSKNSITGAYLSQKKDIPLPSKRRPVELNARKKHATPCLEIKGANKHNISNLNLRLPLQKFVCLSGISGSGKSTLLSNVIHQGLTAEAGRFAEDAASYRSLKTGLPIAHNVLVDQSPISKTPRSNAALYSEAWDDIRKLFAQCDGAKSAGLVPGHFSFNAGEGRCDHCNGLGYEKIEMQFLSDVFVTCPICEGKRFKPDILAITWQGKSIADVLEMDVASAIAFFSEQAKIIKKLQPLIDCGLGYLPLGQPLNTLSGGESQRLKLVKYLSQVTKEQEHTLILLDEPTTGLHRHDISRLIQVLQKLTDLGHSLCIIEHQIDVLKSADWIIEMGPEAGAHGGQIVAEGTPETIARSKTATATFLKEALSGTLPKQTKPKATPAKNAKRGKTLSKRNVLAITGAREHNLNNLSIEIPQREITVVTGVSGSGKSSLAFDIIFAEGQRRFMESMSAYARQFVEQMPRPDVDRITGIAPTVAIEQRVTHGSRKSTVATITEVAQYLRLLYAKIGIQHSPDTDLPVVPQSLSAIEKNIKVRLSAKKSVYLCVSLIRARKGHHEPLAKWAIDHGYEILRIDGKLVPLKKFKKLDRYKEHDIELVLSEIDSTTQLNAPKTKLLSGALKIGKGSCCLVDKQSNLLAWFSTSRTDPTTGEAYPELDPKHFSWNSAKGWCPTCRGHGSIHDWMYDHDDFTELPRKAIDGQVCPTCNGGRLNPISAAVKLYFKDRSQRSLPELLRLPPSDLLHQLKSLKLDKRGQQVAADIIPQIIERLQFMDHVGLSYLTLDRSTSTLSGGEAQRIRLAGQLSSNLSGVLYVLDEPSIGLHARDNTQLIQSLHELKEKGNTLIVVEHDDETMRAADRILDLGPGAGIHGGNLLANSDYKTILKNKESLTGQFLKQGIPHPLRGSYRSLPKAFSPRSKADNQDWLVLKNPNLRNLKGDDLKLPIGRLVMVCGISGAGKSTLFRDVLKPAVAHAISKKKQQLNLTQDLPLLVTKPKGKKQASPTTLTNGNCFKQVIEVDQNPIGKTTRSTPATYIGAFDIIRKFFATLPEAKMHGYKPGHFSFNTKGGRCETCQGGGRMKLEMAFLPDSYITCEACNGLRYGSELLEVRFKGKNIAEVLQMSFEEAVAFFDFHTQLKAMLTLMVETGLGYLTLGQSSPTLSGGEAQRLKLVSELAKGLPTFKEKSYNIKFNNLYLLEEPTIGLHLSDCQKLIELFHRLVEQGHTVVVIEHHLDLIAEADYVVEIGPDGGEAGGHVLYQGNLAGLKKLKSSPTAQYL